MATTDHASIRISGEEPESIPTKIIPPTGIPFTFSSSNYTT